MLRAVCILAALLLLPLAAAHTAAPPRSHETRLLHDCVDDYFGDDSGFGNNRDGYDLHTVDLREAWSSALGDHIVFRIILNGEGPTTLTLSFKADGASKSHTFQGEGSSWTGSFDQVSFHDDLEDGARFALEGAIKRSNMGASVGDKITDVQLVGSHDGDTHDSLPGDDTGALQSCSDDYNPGTGYTLRGPVQYVSASFDQASVEVANGQEKFVTLDLNNLLRDAAQEATVSLNAGDSVRLHDPRTGQYVSTGSFDLNKKGSAGSSSFIHVAVGGAEGSGTATVTVTTDLGGRVSQALAYEILPAGETPTTTTTTTAQEGTGEDAPAAPIALLVVGLVLLARRR